MTVKILLGPAAAGKTHACLKRVLELRSEKLELPLWLLVPDRLQAVAVRRRLAGAGGALGVQVGTFEDLYREILTQTGEPVPLAPNTVVQVLLRDAVLELAQRGALPHYQPIAASSGFAQRMAESIAELKRARRSPQDVEAAAPDQALKDIATVYAAYQERLRAVGWEDREGLAWRVEARLESDPSLWSEPRALFVDGFDSLDAVQLGVLQQLARRIPELWLTLAGSQQMARIAFRRFRSSFEDLKAAFPQAEVDEVEPHSGSIPAGLRAFEQGLFETPASPSPATTAVIEMLELRDPAQEAREALRWVKARMRRDQMHADACAIVVPDPERYRPLLQQAAREFGLRLRANFGERLPRSPAVAALLDLLRLPLEGWPRRSLLDTVRSPYFDLSPWELELKDALALDAASRHGQIVEGLAIWRETLARLARARQSPEREDEMAGRSGDLPQGEVAERLLEGLNGLAARLEPPTSQPVGDWVRWLEDLLDEVLFPARLNTKEDQAAFERLRDTLRALLLGQSLGRQQPLSYASFLEQWRTALEGISFRRRLEPQLPAVTVLRVLEARGLRYQAVALLGLSEGLIPEVEREDPFLPEGVRAKLGLEPRLERDQAGLFYQAATRADERLLLTRPYLADDGQLWEPSPYWRAAERQFDAAPERISTEAPRPLVEAASPQELLFWGVRRGSLPKSLHADHQRRWRSLREAGEVLAARLADEPAGPFEGFTRPAPGFEASDWLWSPSRLERYGTCPHFYWVSTVLAIESREPPELGFDAAQLGSMLHAILERAYAEAQDATEVNSVLEALERVSQQEFELAPEKYGFRPTPLWQLEQEQLRESLQETVRGLHELESGWVPLAFEEPFGIEGAAPLEIEFEDGRMVVLRGLIDRVDRNQRGELRVLDYKTGSSHLSPRDLTDGRRLQLPLYARAAQDALELGRPVEGLYWSILRAEQASLRLSNFDQQLDGRTYEGPQGAFALAKLHIGRSLSGISAGRFPPEPPRGGCPSYCPAAAWCWRYTPAEYG